VFSWSGFACCVAVPGRQPIEGQGVASRLSIPAELADRYATALYELAEPAQALDAVAADLGRLKQAVGISREFQVVLQSPSFPRAQKTAAAVAIAQRVETNALTHKFVGAIGRFGRLASLVQVIDAYVAMLARRRGETSAEVTTARPLNDAQRQDIARILAGVAKRPVTLVEKTDPRILGGLTLRYGARMIDASLSTKLQRLRLAMKGSA
jgi:F-type H+-transporting ATPase subunit delta